MEYASELVISTLGHGDTLLKVSGISTACPCSLISPGFISVDLLSKSMFLLTAHICILISDMNYFVSFNASDGLSHPDTWFCPTWDLYMFLLVETNLIPNLSWFIRLSSTNMDNHVIGSHYLRNTDSRWRARFAIHLLYSKDAQKSLWTPIHCGFLEVFDQASIHSTHQIAYTY